MGNRGEALRWCGEVVHRMAVRSHSSSLRGVSTLVHPCSRLVLDGQAVDEMGIHHAHQFGGDRAQPPVLQRNPRTPSFSREVTSEALWLDGWSTSARLKARLELATLGRLQSHAGYGTGDSGDIPQGNRLPSADSGVKNLVSASSREPRQIVQGGGGRMHMHRARTMSEAIANLKNRQQLGIAVDSSMYVEVLKRCLKERDLLAARQVHDCMIKGGMHQNAYVATNLLRVYVRCGRLQDARRVFDELVRKDVILWNVMIGGYAQHNCAKEAMEAFDGMCQAGAQPDEVSYLTILKACASPSALNWGKKVHASIRHSTFESDVRVGTALLMMYAKCGCLDEARGAFEKLTTRDVMTWNAMIGACVDNGCGWEAYQFFLQMKGEGFKPNEFTFMSILSACTSAGDLEWAKEVHNHVLEAGFESDLHVCSALIRTYAKSGSIDDARVVFDRMTRRDVVTWTAMMGAYAESGCGPEAYRLLLQMKREGFKPDAVTYVSILNASASAGALEWVKEVHNDVREAGLDTDLRVGKGLVRIYAKSGSIDDARLAFDRMRTRDVITWNAMIGAYADCGGDVEACRLFVQMKRDGLKPDAFTYVSLLNTSASAGALEWVKEVDKLVLEAGLDSDLRVGNALVHMYARSGSIVDARVVFDRMGKRDIVTWNSMIGAYAENGCGVEAYSLFLQMQREGYVPNAVTYTNILNASASAGALEWVKKVHSHSLEAGLQSDLRVGNALVHMYGKIGSLDDARPVFDRMEKRDVITWTVMIGAYAENGCGAEAYRLFLQMLRDGFKPDAFTYVSILNPSAIAGPLEWVKEIHSEALKAGLESDVRVGSALVHMYAKTGCIDEARLVFVKMKERNVITWNVMIGGLALHGLGREALELFRKMNAAGIKPDGASFAAILSACCHAGLLADGRRLFSAMSKDYGIYPTVEHYTCMVDLLGRAGRLEEAALFIGSMPVEPVGATWGALLGACRTYGNVELGELAAKEFLNLEPKDPSAYVLLSNIYAATGDWEKESSVRTLMQKRGGVRKEPGRSWIEIDDKIHDFVAGDTSHPEAKAIDAELNSLAEKIKAEGYIPDAQPVFQNSDEEDKNLAICSHSEKLAIAYGLMRTPRGKLIRVFKDFRICSDCHRATKFISKITGREIISRDASRFHHFRDGVCSCGDYW